MKNKKIIIVICIIILLLIIAFIYFAISETNTNDKDVNTINNVNIENTLSKEPNISEDKSLSNLSFNGIKIGDKIEEKMKNLVLDAPYKYEYENICIDTYTQNDNIGYLAFFTSSDAEGNKSTSIENVNIRYNNNKLETISDFKENLGNGTESEKETRESGEHYSIEYYDNDLELSVSIINNEIYNVILKEK